MSNEISKAAFLGFEDIKLSNGETIKVAALPIRKFNEFIDALEDELKLAELFTGLTQEEVEKLAIDDLGVILERGMALNRDPFLKWKNLRMKVLKAACEILGRATDEETTGEDGAS